MELNHRIEEPGVLVVESPVGNLDATNARAFREATAELLRDHTKVVFDMSRLKFVDSSGLGALIACLRETNARRGDFRLCGMSRQVRALFELMRMHRVFAIHDDMDGALASFR